MYAMNKSTPSCKAPLASSTKPNASETIAPASVSPPVLESLSPKRHWKKAASQYEDFLNRNKDGRIVYLELGVGGNTPGIIKYPFWKMTFANPKATYICINKGEAAVPQEIEKQSLCVNNDIWEFLQNLIPQN